MIDDRINQKLTEVVRQTDQKIHAAVDPLAKKMDRIDTTINANFQTFAATINQNITDTITDMFQSLGMAHTPGLVTPQSNPAPVSTSNRYAALSSSGSGSFKTPNTSSTHR
jgi:hypothetical protein